MSSYEPADESDRDAIETAIALAKSDRTSTWEEALRQQPNRIRPYDGDDSARRALTCDADEGTAVLDGEHSLMGEIEARDARIRELEEKEEK